MEYDAIVIGAGPAGSMATRTLAEQGRAVLLLERGSFPGRKKACGGMLSYQDFLDFNLDQSTIETRMEQEISVYPWMRKTIYYPVVTVKRAVFDEHLACQARKAGATLSMSSRAVDVSILGNGNVRVDAMVHGTLTDFRAKVVIFSDGVNTLAPRTAGLGFRKDKDTGFGIVYELECLSEMNEYFIFFNPEGLTQCGYSWIFPTQDSLNVGIYMPHREFIRRHHRSAVLEEYCKTAESEFARLIRGRRIRGKAGAFIPTRGANKICSDSAIAIGDAAGLVSPLSGAGIHHALYSGWLAGSVVERALREKDFSRKTLGEYERAIKRSRFFRSIRNESLLYRLGNTFKKVYPLGYPKMFHIYKQLREYSFLNNLRIVAYPILGKPKIGLGEH